MVEVDYPSLVLPPRVLHTCQLRGEYFNIHLSLLMREEAKAWEAAGERGDFEMKAAGGRLCSEKLWMISSRLLRGSG